MRQYFTTSVYRLAFFAVAVISALMVPEAQADAASLQIQSSIIMREVNPGETFTHTFIVNNTSQTDLDISIKAAGLGQGLDGAYVPLSCNADISPQSGRSFITDIDEPCFSLVPGRTQAVTVTFKIPENIQAGGYYALIDVQRRRSAETTAEINLGFHIPVVLTVTGGRLDKSGTISDIVLKCDDEGVARVITEVSNTGNYHFRASNRISVYDESKVLVERISLPITSSSIIPGNERIFTAELSTREQFIKEDFVIISEIVGDDGMTIASRSITVGDDCRLPVKEYASFDYRSIFPIFWFLREYLR